MPLLIFLKVIRLFLGYYKLSFITNTKSVLGKNVDLA